MMYKVVLLNIQNFVSVFIIIIIIFIVNFFTGVP